MTDRNRARGLTLLFCSAALAGVTGCGGGGGGAAPSDPAATSAPAPADAAVATAAGTAPAPTPAPQPQANPADVSPAIANAAAPAVQGPAATQIGGASFGGGAVDLAQPPAPSPATAPAPAPAAASGGSSPQLADCDMFPASAIFNTRIDDTSRFPVHASSANWIAMAGGGLPFMTNWGGTDNQADATAYFGMPFNVVDGSSATTEWPVISFDYSTSGVIMDKGYPDKSDCAVPNASGGYDIGRPCGSMPVGQRHWPFPLASNLKSEGGFCNDPNSCGDKHVLVVERGACRLWESFFTYKLSNQWYTTATAAWDLHSLSLRPNDWGSGDAAGLPITPLLAKASEASSGEIRHALRVNFRNGKLSQQHVWPARFAAGSGGPETIPFGALLRLKADFVIPDNWNTQAKALATAAKRYGMYVSDNGADFYVTGEPSSQWDMAVYQQLQAIKLSDMEFVDLKSITSDPRFSADSMAASW